MKVVSGVLMFFLFFNGISCASRIKIAASIFPLYSIAKSIVQENGEVKLIVPPLASPHTFEFSPKSIANLEGTKVIFCIGHKLDSWILGVRQAYSDKIKIITVDNGIKLIKNNGIENPHYWLSPLNAIKIAKNISKALQRLFPEKKTRFRESYLHFKEDITKMYKRTLLKVKPFKGKMLLTYHRAYDYLAEAYGFQILGSLQPPGGKEITPQHLKSLMKKIKKYHVKVFFMEPQIPMNRVKSFISDLSLKIHYLDPLGGVKGRKDYASLILFDINNILSAFGGNTE